MTSLVWNNWAQYFSVRKRASSGVVYLIQYFVLQEEEIGEILIEDECHHPCGRETWGEEIHGTGILEITGKLSTGIEWESEMVGGCHRADTITGNISIVPDKVLYSASQHLR